MKRKSIDRIGLTQSQAKTPAVPDRYAIVIPNWHPLTLNQMIGWNRFVISRKKKVDRKLIAGYVLKCGVPPAIGKRRVVLTITLAPRQRAADPDAYFKATLDSLVHAKALKSDDRFGVECAPVIYERGSAKISKIELEDIDA
jgi:hypothetical protein